ncbi:hypothetical protein AMATHDRAFT_175667 [Amanita thiersii Skay4041]|uniref:Pentatricopeptide repeat-containing protein-mitochondrial domain-containing protein n=1 Tax=Amanita thiersii Skay4041 TaxID=703135 RepID=A0A2A9NTW8_9AGAR|nr:hypothetical protein AMATHDRAFT_175667 [Amanita thiersii Skay4041]
MAAHMKLQNIAPDWEVYNALMNTAAACSSYREAWAIFEDMVLVGVKPDISMINHLIYAHRQRSSLYLWLIIDRMNQLEITPNVVTFTLLINHFIADKNLELALRYFHDARARGLVPQIKAMHNLVMLAANLNHPRLAIDLANWFEEKSAQHLDHSTWLACLSASAMECYAEGVLHCWKVVVEDQNLTPDQGVCVSVLNTAARHGLPDLATEALRMLKAAGETWEEYHFAAVIEAFCRNSQIKEAMITLDIMRTHGTPATLETTIPILNAMSISIDVFDRSWGIIEEIQKEGKRIDLAALNVLIQASIRLGDLQRAVGTYKSFGEYQATPDIFTFNALLDGCISTNHRQLGDVLLNDMKAAKVQPNEDTYEKMILLCLTQNTYEDAFFYLEEMKVSGYKPYVRIYAALIRKCIVNDDPRYQIAVEEMAEQGYEMPISLARDIRQYANNNGQKGQGGSEVQENVRLDGASQRFIETGGLQEESKAS